MKITLPPSGYLNRCISTNILALLGSGVPEDPSFLRSTRRREAPPEPPPQESRSSKPILAAEFLRTLHFFDLPEEARPPIQNLHLNTIHTQSERKFGYE